MVTPSTDTEPELIMVWAWLRDRASPRAASSRSRRWRTAARLSRARPAVGAIQRRVQRLVRPGKMIMVLADRAVGQIVEFVEGRVDLRIAGRFTGLGGGRFSSRRRSPSWPGPSWPGPSSPARPSSPPAASPVFCRPQLRAQSVDLCAKRLDVLGPGEAQPCGGPVDLRGDQLLEHLAIRPARVQNLLGQLAHPITRLVRRLLEAGLGEQCVRRRRGTGPRRSGQSTDQVHIRL